MVRKQGGIPNTSYSTIVFYTYDAKVGYQTSMCSHFKNVNQAWGV